MITLLVAAYCIEGIETFQFPVQSLAVLHQIELVLFLQRVLPASIPDYQVHHLPGQDF